MERHVNVLCEALANHSRFNMGVIFGAIIVQSICTIAVMSAAYFLGMRKGVDITDNYYAEVVN